MRAATIRRCLVFGVCALGVIGLYVAPSHGRTSYPVSQPPADEEPTGAVVTAMATARAAAATPAARRTASTKTADEESEPTSAPTARAATRPVAAASPTSSSRRVSRGATAYEPDNGHDDQPPQPVRKITPSKVTPEQLSLSWPEASDNIRVVGYHVWLSGFQVASTAETHATVRWFNDDTAQHVVQVKAVDAAGNEAPTSPSLLVSRPGPDSTESPQPSASPTSKPDVEPSPSGDPSESSRATVNDPSATAGASNGGPG